MKQWLPHRSLFILTFMIVVSCAIRSTASQVKSRPVPDDEVQPKLSAFPGNTSDWHGFDRYDFEVDGKPVLVIVPKEVAAGRPWVWHGEFFGHKPAPDIALLNRGFHIVYMRVPDLLGSPKAVEHWNNFYSELTGKYQLAAKAALVGLSRGGLYCYNWAIANPEKVACIYADAAVCDFKSWPGGRGKGKGSPRDWKLVLDVYGFASEDEALSYKENPVDRLEPLARAGVPLLHIYGDADDIVPWEENTGVVADRYKALGGSITLIAKPGVSHHPHGLDDPNPIVEFIHRHSLIMNELNQEQEPKPTTLRVLSYNIHHAEGVDGKLDLQRIADVVKSVNPDLVSLQEVDRLVKRTNNVDQPAELAQLTGLHVVFGANIDLQGGQYGNAILSRWPIHEHTNRKLPCLDNGEQRGVLDALIQLPQLGNIRFLATHFDHRSDDQERRLSAKFINQLVDVASTSPGLLAGDLNDMITSPALQTLQQRWAATSTEIQATVPVRSPLRQIDFILYQPASRWRLIESRVLSEAVASDHRAILAVLELGGPIEARINSRTE